MVKVGVRAPGHRAWTRASEVLECRTFYGVLQAMAFGLRKRGVAHVVMEASGVCAEPVCYALMERDFERVAVINPARATALKGKWMRKTRCGWRSCLSAGRLRLGRIALFGAAVAGLERKIAVKVTLCRRELGLLESIPGFGDAVACAWLAEIGPAPHEY